MSNYFESFVYVIDPSNTIRKAIELFLRDYKVESFENFESFNAHILKQDGNQPYIVLVESSYVQLIPRGNNRVIVLKSGKGDYFSSEDTAIIKPFTKDELKEKIKSEFALIHKEFLDYILPINDVEEQKRVKV
jgi:FixJ family two-component response regulator